MREFAKLGLTRSVGGVLALALSRELTPVVTAIILAGRVGSAFAAELGTMLVRGSGEMTLAKPVPLSLGRVHLLYRPWHGVSSCNLIMQPLHLAGTQVSEQMDSLRVLNTDPVDYLVTPRVLACMIAGPILNVLCFCMGETRGAVEVIWGVSCCLFTLSISCVQLSESLALNGRQASLPRPGWQTWCTTSQQTSSLTQPEGREGVIVWANIDPAADNNHTCALPLRTLS